MRKGRYMVAGRPMSAEDVKFVFRLSYSLKTIREALRSGEGDMPVRWIEARCDEIVSERRKAAGAKCAATIKAKFDREECAVPIPAHDYTRADRAAMAWRGPAEGRLYGMVGVAG